MNSGKQILMSYNSISIVMYHIKFPSQYKLFNYFCEFDSMDQSRSFLNII